MGSMLASEVIERVLTRLPNLHLGVVGDLFLDRYLDLNAGLTEPSIETGLDAYQVVGVRSYPGAAGTIINNLVALRVGKVSVLSVIGQDGEGYELRRELERRQVNLEYLLDAPDRFTPTYTKPMLQEPGRPARELNRLDIKNRTPLPKPLEARVLERLPPLIDKVDALLVLDQVSEPDCGVVTELVRARLGELGSAATDKLILADSRLRIGQFRNVSLKPNQAECRVAADGGDVAVAAQRLSGIAKRPVFCTCGEHGILLAQGASGVITQVPGYFVSGPIDPVGAGDSTSAGIACAIAAGATLTEAAAFGNLIASITIQQIGTTGTATPAQVRARWREVHIAAP